MARIELVKQMPVLTHHQASRASAGPYVLVTAAYNEEAYIGDTIRSVVAQTVLPRAWAIVSDASTDRTDDIVQRFAGKYPWIRFLRREKDHHRAFASKVRCLEIGFRALAAESTPFVGHLDADIVLKPAYFVALLRRFADDPMLGIAGGCYEEKIGVKFRLSNGYSPISVPGGLQMFRRECYQEIGPWLPIEYGAEDWHAEIVARKYGWQVRSFRDLRARHLRPAGSAGGVLRYNYRQGFADFCLGTHPAFEVAKLAKRMAWQPYVIGASARLLGFLVAHVRAKRMVSSELVAFLRNDQLSRLGLAKLATRKRISNSDNPHHK
jgi:biofilm PGA synthesis N-glycosyltransferase PgaC